MDRPDPTSKAYPPALNLRLARLDEMVQYDDLMERHHRRGASVRTGHELHHLVEDWGQWIAWSAFRWPP